MLRAALFCALLSAGLLSGPADARSRDRDRSHDDAIDLDEREERDDRGSRRDRRDAANEAARLAQQANGGGRVLSVERVSGGHRVKVLKDGVVRVFVIEDGR